MRAMLGAWAVALGLWMLYGFTWIWRGVFLLSPTGPVQSLFSHPLSYNMDIYLQLGSRYVMYFRIPSQHHQSYKTHTHTLDGFASFLSCCTDFAWPRSNRVALSHCCRVIHPIDCFAVRGRA